MNSDTRELEGAGVDSSGIRIGIFVPSVVSSKRKKKEVGNKKNKEWENENEETESSGITNKKVSRRRGRDSSVEGFEETVVKRSKASTEEDSPPMEESTITKQRKWRSNISCKKRRKGQEFTMPQPTGKGTDRESALHYLQQWDSDRDNWSFKKKTQYWLLQNACDKSQIPKHQFKILLCYMEGLQGNQRTVVAAKMKDIVDRYQPDSGDKHEGDEKEAQKNSTISRTVYKRTVAILRVIA